MDYSQINLPTDLFKQIIGSMKSTTASIGEKIGGGGGTLSPGERAKITYENGKTIVETNRGTFTLVPIKKADYSTLKTINPQDPEAFARDFYPYKSIRELMMSAKPCPNASYVPEGYRTFTLG